MSDLKIASSAEKVLFVIRSNLQLAKFTKPCSVVPHSSWRKQPRQCCVPATHVNLQALYASRSLIENFGLSLSGFWESNRILFAAEISAYCRRRSSTPLWNVPFHIYS